MGRQQSEELLGRISRGELSLDLEALLSKERSGDVMTALQEQLGPLVSIGDVINVLSAYDDSGVLSEASPADVYKWFKDKLPPLKTSKAIEGAVAGIAGKYEPILTRFYAKKA